MHCDAWSFIDLLLIGRSIITSLGTLSLCLMYFTVKKDSVRTMLAVVTYLRTQNLPKRGRGQGTLWDNNFWLDLDYLEVASAAQRCSACFTALLYTEIWADIQK